jgi:hypothetical protein
MSDEFGGGDFGHYPSVEAEHGDLTHLQHDLDQEFDRHAEVDQLDATSHHEHTTAFYQNNDIHLDTPSVHLDEHDSKGFVDHDETDQAVHAYSAEEDTHASKEEDLDLLKAEFDRLEADGGHYGEIGHVGELHELPSEDDYTPDVKR